MDGLTDVLPKDGWIIDLGCGDGKLLRELGGRGHGVVGLDRSGHALRLAAAADAALVQGDVTRLPLKPGRFDLVIARYVLGALGAADRALAARHAWDAVAPGGRLWLEEFSTEDFRAHDGSFVEPGTVERNRGILSHYWTPSEVTDLLDIEPQRLTMRTWMQRTRHGKKTRQAIQATWSRPTA